MIKREVKLEEMLISLIDRNGYTRNRQPILDSIRVTAAALSQYTRGRTRPSFDKLVALADFFNVSLDYLVYGERSSDPVDPSSITRYFEQALLHVRASTDRHSDVVGRIGRLLLDRIDEVAREIANSRSAGIEGLIELEEVLGVERYCRQANITTTDLEPNIITIEGGEAVPGQFFPVVTANLARGCTYRFLLADELDAHSSTVGLLRKMIADIVGGDIMHEHCFFRTAASPVAGAAVLYQLDAPAFAAEALGLFTQFSKYLHNGTWLGYLNRPNDDSTADMLMAPSYVERACKAFDEMWNAAST